MYCIGQIRGAVRCGAIQSGLVRFDAWLGPVRFASGPMRSKSTISQSTLYHNLPINRTDSAILVQRFINVRYLIRHRKHTSKMQ